MRISDWSSDVCSSDLVPHRLTPRPFCLLPRCEFDRPEPRSIRRVEQQEMHAAVRQQQFDHQPIAVERHGADLAVGRQRFANRSEEHTSELQSLMRISYAVFCLKKKKQNKT